MNRKRRTEAAGYRELLEKLKSREKKLYRLLVQPEEEPVLRFSLVRYLPMAERVGQEACMREMPLWAEFWKNPPMEGIEALIKGLA